MMDSFFSILPKGMFGHNHIMEGILPVRNEGMLSFSNIRTLFEDNGRKRSRSLESLEETSSLEASLEADTSPALTCTHSKYSNLRIVVHEHDATEGSGIDESSRPTKRIRRELETTAFVIPNPLAASSLSQQERKIKDKSTPLEKLPEDIVAHCLSFLNSTEDRFALQCTSKQFQRLSNTDEMLIGIEVGGDRNTGKHGIIREHDTPDSASDKLTPFAVAGNLEALYMIGIIKSYCYQDVEYGISLLKMASAQGYVRASYALGLVLRDSQPKDAASYMELAAHAKYLPALQELLPAREMKAKYGEPNADQLRRHLDHLCLNRLLSRHYIRSPELRVLNTSHCWNPLCGRWAFKATVNSRCPPSRSIRRPWSFAFFRQQENQPTTPSENSHSHDSIESVVLERPSTSNSQSEPDTPTHDVRVSRMKMCSRCCRAKYCSKLCQVYDWRSGRHKMECQFL